MGKGCRYTVLFVDSDRDYRYLHAFPTRRSSDLGEGLDAGEETDEEVDDAIIHQEQHAGDGSKRGTHHEGERNRLLRSEEHTSELQSRQYLVCRLLLEKKNAINHRYTHHYHGSGT